MLDMSPHLSPVTRRYVLVPFAKEPAASAELRRLRLARVDPHPADRPAPERFEYLKRTYD